MDSPSEPTPAKKRCNWANKGKLHPMQQCVQEFQLPRQFPSTMKQVLKMSVINPDASAFVLPDTKKVSPNGKNRLPYNLQKLRILSPGGRDLGEFNVKLRSADSLNGNTITITKSNSKLNGKPLTLPLSPISHARVFPRILRQSTSKISRRNLLGEMSCNSSVLQTDNSASHQQHSVTENKKISNGQNMKVCYETDDADICDLTNIQETAAENNDISSATETLFNEIIELPSSPNSKIFKINSSHRSSMTSPRRNLNNGSLAQECNIPLVSTSIKDMTNVMYNGIVGHTTRYNTQSKSLMAESQNDSPVSDSHVQRIPESPQITNIGTNVQSNVQSKDCPKDFPQEKSDQLNIIKKAMESVKDSELRELALKALADCGIGIERYVPIRPPEDHKVVHDAKVQTLVFGLLDPKSFILMNKNLDDIHRLNQITLYDMPNENLLAYNSHYNESVLKDPNVFEQESPFDLDNFLEQFWKENSDALKMKKTLSVSRVRCNSLLGHLQKDFEGVKKYDQNGMLNIHNAVINNNIYLVQRQLMVLQHCKQSIDIMTEDGVTSLELSIKHDVCSEIVKLLLDAGAQPVIPKFIRESALIIASKLSSPLLPMLISQISDAKLLDQVDSEGLAAIHYCSIHGNLEGAKALLSAGATTDLKDMRSGRTPLFHAIDNCHNSVMKVLLKAGAVANIANYAGQTPLAVISDSKSQIYTALKKNT